MENSAHARVPPRIVPYNPKTSDSIQVNIVKRKLTQREALVVNIPVCFLIAKCQGERSGQQPVVGKDIIIGISARERIIFILHLIKFKVVLQFHRRIFQFLSYQALQPHVVQLDQMPRVANACQERPTAAPLACTLAECCRIREFSVVEDIIEVKSFDAHIDA